MKFLIVVDVQNDFIDGSLGTSEAKEVLELMKGKIEVCKKNNTKLIFTRDTHYPSYLNTLEGKNLPIMHCLFMTKGWEIHEDLQSYAEDSYIIDKFTFGSFHLAETISHFLHEQNKTELDVKEIELVGLCTDVCVIANAIILKTYFPNIQITVDAKCCAGTTPKNHKIALQAMKNLQINIINEE